MIGNIHVTGRKVFTLTHGLKSAGEMGPEARCGRLEEQWR